MRSVGWIGVSRALPPLAKGEGPGGSRGERERVTASFAWHALSEFMIAASNKLMHPLICFVYLVILNQSWELNYGVAIRRRSSTG